MTNKERVLAKWPKANAVATFDPTSGKHTGFAIITAPGVNDMIGSALTRRWAWENAANRLPK